jgi:hypothetical protein
VTLCRFVARYSKHNKTIIQYTIWEITNIMQSQHKEYDSDPEDWAILRFICPFFLVCEWLKKPAVLLGESLWLATDILMFPSLPARGRGESLCRLSAAWVCGSARGDFPYIVLGKAYGGVCVKMLWRHCTWSLDRHMSCLGICEILGGPIARNLGILTCFDIRKFTCDWQCISCYADMEISLIVWCGEVGICRA